MNNNREINFPAIKSVTKIIDNQIYVWDSLRGRYLLLTPEEQVRQHVIAFLISHLGVIPQSIAQEYPVELNGTAQRADIVVMDKQLRPIILVECKAPDIAINQEVLAQAVRYNSVLKAQYIILTNGHNHLCIEMVDGVYKKMNNFPIIRY